MQLDAGVASQSERSVSVATGEVLVREGGDPALPLLLYFHDEVTSVPSRFVERLASHRHVLAPVLPGFGTSSRPDWVETVPLLVEHLMSYVDTVVADSDGSERLAIVGASLGGWVAAEIALRLTSRSPALILIGAAGLKVSGHPTADHWFVDPKDRRDILWRDASAAPEVDLDEYLANEESAARYAWNPRFVDETLGPRMARFRGTALVMFGAEDRFLSVQHANAWGAVLPGSDVDVFPNTGHFVSHERPDEAADRVLRWLDRADAR